MQMRAEGVSRKGPGMVACAVLALVATELQVHAWTSGSPRAACRQRPGADDAICPSMGATAETDDELQLMQMPVSPLRSGEVAEHSKNSRDRAAAEIRVHRLARGHGMGQLGATSRPAVRGRDDSSQPAVLQRIQHNHSKVLKEPTIFNPSFEADKEWLAMASAKRHASGMPAHDWTVPSAWHSFDEKRVAIIPSGDTNWDHKLATDGDYFVGIQGEQNTLEQTVGNLEEGELYLVTFSAAGGPPHEAVTLEVRTDNRELGAFKPGNDFNTYTCVFAATHDSGDLIFENWSPEGHTHDRTVFLDDIRVQVAPLLHNGGFDWAEMTLSYEFATPAGWESQGSSIVIRGTDPTWGGVPAIEGNYYAGLQHKGARLSQTVNDLEAGGLYELTLSAMAHDPECAVEVWVGKVITDVVGETESTDSDTRLGALLARVTPTIGRFNETSIHFYLKEESAPISLVNACPDQGIVFVDDVSIALVPLEEVSTESEDQQASGSGSDSELPEAEEAEEADEEPSDSDNNVGDEDFFGEDQEAEKPPASGAESH